MSLFSLFECLSIVFPFFFFFSLSSFSSEASKQEVGLGALPWRQAPRWVEGEGQCILGPDRTVASTLSSNMCSM